jgi:hypothetical protein
MWCLIAQSVIYTSHGRFDSFHSFIFPLSRVGIRHARRFILFIGTL